MEENFWHKRWKDLDIAFHRDDANPLLVKYFNELSLAQNSRIFIPLCGKTLDIGWLLSNGFRVAGAELSSTAVDQLFIDLGTEPTISKLGNFDHYSAKDIDIFVGNIFELSSEILGPIDAIYDRAAMVALPEDMRLKYKAQLLGITKQAPQLLITYEYDQKLMNGPPFSVSNDEVRQHYADHYKMSLLETTDIDGGLKGQCASDENVWLLSRP